MCSAKKNISLFGSTGSVGQSTLDLVRNHPDKFKINVLTAHKNVDLLASQANEFEPSLICIVDETLQNELQSKVSNPSIKILSGEAGLIEAAHINCDLHIAAIMGFAGLKPMTAGMKHCRHMGIANKEPLVAAGIFVKQAAALNNVKLLPIDSEHNAIFQVFETQNQNQITKLYLTASGGPFRNLSLNEIENKTPAEAINHPNWSMGAKISVDSATMMNKALEIIEAHELFDMGVDQIDVLLHPQSIVHSMVEYTDGSVLAQMGPADMRTPLAHMLAYPKRMATSGERLNLQHKLNLNFEPLDHDRFPAVPMAIAAVKSGLAARIALNAANEVLVEAFLTEKISFGRIIPYLNQILVKRPETVINSIDDVYTYDHIIRHLARAFLNDLFLNKDSNG